MMCSEANALIARHADGELEGLRRHSLARHLRGCPQCTHEHQGILELRQALRASIPRYEAPPALRERLEALAAADVPEAAPALVRPRRWTWAAGGALAGGAATILAWTVATAVIDSRTSEDLAAEAVNSHVRATLGNHLVAVVSSDQHTVKPWLSARLDYAPPVKDFAAEGFTLVGARVDALEHRPVAALVYRYREHSIDVFVRPRSALLPKAAATVRGFNVARATNDEMEWIAVSDTNAEALAAFVRRVAGAGASP